MQKLHLKRPFFPEPLQKKHRKGPVPEPLQLVHTPAIADSLEKTKPVAMAANLIAPRRVILAIKKPPTAGLVIRRTSSGY